MTPMSKVTIPGVWAVTMKQETVETQWAEESLRIWVQH